MTFLTGKDYPELCETCRHMIDVAVDLVIEGPDTDDEEAPINFVYDHHLFCGGDHCAVEEQSRLDQPHQVSGSVDDLTAARVDFYTQDDPRCSLDHDQEPIPDAVHN